MPQIFFRWNFWIAIAAVIIDYVAIVAVVGIRIAITRVSASDGIRIGDRGHVHVSGGITGQILIDFFRTCVLKVRYCVC